MSSHIEYQRFRRGETCTEEGCRAKKFYIEDGKKFCQRGHEQFGFTQTQQDEDDWNAQGKKSRKKREEKERIETVLSGRDAKELYLQCYQLILWKQCHWLVSIKGFPPQLETIVRDLWDLRTRHLQMARERQSIYGSGTGTTMMFSSQSEGGTDHETDVSGRRSVASRKSRKTAVTEDKLPKLVESLGLCYLGILMLRLPMSLGDLFKWAARDEIIYTRAIKEVPKDMRSKLPASYHSALEISAPFKQSALNRTIMELVDFFNKQFELTFPGPNISHLLAKHVRDLCLPVETIPSVKRLASLLSITFTYPLHSPKNHKVTIYPEVQLICLIVIATKLGQPFGEGKHLATSDSDLSAIKIDWKKWVSIMAEERAPGLKRGQEVHVKENDVWGMTALQIDEYLDWYQRTWIDDRDLKMPSQILDLFPLAPIPPASEIPHDPETPVSRIQAVHESMIWNEPSPHFDDAYGERVERCGERYIRYRKTEELSDTAQAFYEVAASNAGVSLEMLVRGVFLLEVQLDSWLRRQKRKEAAMAAAQKGMGSEDDEDW